MMLKLKKSKKAQISSQVFVYILAAVIVGIILMVGYKAISTIIGFTSKVPVEDFIMDFDSSIHRVSRSYGSVKKFEFTLPEKFDEVCFIDSMNKDNKFEISPDSAENEWIRDIITDNVKENVFLLKQGAIKNEKKIYVDDLDVASDYLCIKNQGLMELWLEGTGRKACLKKDQSEKCS